MHLREQTPASQGPAERFIGDVRVEAIPGGDHEYHEAARAAEKE
ncbi:hypothetical protein [Microbacterium jejuense]